MPVPRPLSPHLPALLLLASTLALGWILLPFWGAILWAVVIAMLFLPLFRRLLPRLRGRRSATAAVVMGVVLLIGVLPFALLSAALAREAAAVYQRIDSGSWQPALAVRQLFDALPPAVVDLLDRMGVADFDTLQQRVASLLAQGSQRIASQALSIGLGTFDFVSSLFITLYLAFFFIRDGDALARSAWAGVPLAADAQRDLSGKFITVVRATVKGSLVVAMIQGALGGLAFWALGLTAPLLWGVLMAFLSLVPAVGAALVWGPVAAWLLLTGQPGAAAGLLAWGAGVIGVVDNLLRPLLVGQDTRLPDYVVMIATLGGMAAFGLNGFVMGPAIAAMFIAVWHLRVPPPAEPLDPV